MDKALRDGVFSCLHCGRELSGSSQYDGMLMACPHCRGFFVMPTAAGGPGDVGASRPGSAEQTTAGQGAGSPPVSQASQLPPYILPPPRRPGGLGILAVLGLIFCNLVLLGGILVIVSETTNFFVDHPENYKPSLFIVIEWAVRCLLMICFLEICFGLLKNKKKARFSFLLLAGIIIFGELFNFCVLWVYKPDQIINYRINLFKGIGLLYIIIGSVYLRQKQVRNWFNYKGV